MIKCTLHKNCIPEQNFEKSSSIKFKKFGLFMNLNIFFKAKAIQKIDLLLK